MDIGVLTAREADYHPNRRLKEAALAKGLSLALIDPRRVSPVIEAGRSGMKGMEDGLLPGVILPRQGAQISESSMVVLSHLQAMGIPVVNGPAAIFAARNKFLTLQILAASGIKVPDSAFVNSAAGFFGAADTLGGFPLVCKKAIGRKGRGVFLVKEKIQAEDFLEKHLVPAEGLMLQRFIPPAERRDLRILVVGGRVVGAMEMVAPEGEFRANFSISGNGRRVDLPGAAEETAVKSALAMGLEIAGVDVIDAGESGYFVIEANYAPGFRGLEAATGIDIAAEIIDHSASFL